MRMNVDKCCDANTTMLPHVAAPIYITSLNETAFTPLDRVLLASVSCQECLGPISGGEPSE